MTQPSRVSPPEERSAADEESAESKRTNYNRLVHEARLLSLLLEKVDFKLLPEAVGINKALLSRDLIGKKTILSAGKEDGICVSSIVWTVTASFKKKIVVRCSATYLISYDGMRGFDESTINEFVETIAKAATYPYFRAMYAEFDWAANLASPPLPILQFRADV